MTSILHVPLDAQKMLVLQGADQVSICKLSYVSQTIKSESESCSFRGETQIKKEALNVARGTNPKYPLFYM